MLALFEQDVLHCVASDLDLVVLQLSRIRVDVKDDSSAASAAKLNV